MTHIYLHSNPTGFPSRSAVYSARVSTRPPREGLIAETREYLALSEKYLPEVPAEGRFQAGDRVRHAFLGDGTVVDVDWVKEVHIVQFDSMSTPRSISFRVALTGLE